MAQGVGSDPGVARGTFAVSATGVLAHRAGGAERRQLVWVDRAGTVLGTVGPPDENALGIPSWRPMVGAWQCSAPCKAMSTCG